MAWKIEFKPSARKAFNRLDRSVQKKILKFLNIRIAPLENPRVFGKPLSYDHYGFWRYRVENFRIVCVIDDNAVTIVVVRVAHRKEVYN